MVKHYGKIYEVPKIDYGPIGKSHSSKMENKLKEKKSQEVQIVFGRPNHFNLENCEIYFFVRCGFRDFPLNVSSTVPKGHSVSYMVNFDGAVPSSKRCQVVYEEQCIHISPPNFKIEDYDELEIEILTRNRKGKVGKHFKSMQTVISEKSNLKGSPTKTYGTQMSRINTIVTEDGDDIFLTTSGGGMYKPTGKKMKQLRELDRKLAKRRKKKKGKKKKIEEMDRSPIDIAIRVVTKAPEIKIAVTKTGNISKFQKSPYNFFP
jgi:hypothetical protein